MLPKKGESPSYALAVQERMNRRHLSQEYVKHDYCSDQEIDLRLSPIHLMKKPTSLTTAAGTPNFCINIGNQPLASLAVAITHSMSCSGVVWQLSMLV